MNTHKLPTETFVRNSLRFLLRKKINFQFCVVLNWHLWHKFYMIFLHHRWSYLRTLDCVLNNHITEIWTVDDKDNIKNIMKTSRFCNECFNFWRRLVAYTFKGYAIILLHDMWCVIFHLCFFEQWITMQKWLLQPF